MDKVSIETQHKSFVGLDLKSDSPGTFTARIATLNVIDKDGDVTLPGAFPNGKNILISAYMHSIWADALPVGKGVIREDNGEVFVDGAFYLNTTAGKEHYETIKNAPELQEWSYGFRVLEVAEGTPWNDNPKVWRVLKKLDVFEASPVLRGAGINTGTLAIKSDEGITFTGQSEAVLAAVKDLTTRVKSLADLRRKEGRKLSPAFKEKLEEQIKTITEMTEELKSLLASPKQPDKAIVASLYLRCQKTLKKLEEI